MRELLKVWEDVITVPEVIGKIAEEYISEGNQVKRLSSMNFKIVLQGGWIHIYWEDGKIWQEIIEEKEEKSVTESESAKELADVEDKKTICRLLCEVLQKTRGCSDLRSLNFDQDEIVTAVFKNRNQKINIAGDSGMAMIRDIVNHLRH